MANKINFIVIIIILCSSFIACNPKSSTLINRKRLLAPTEDVVFVVDISSSMLAEDFTPNRLEAVKAMLNEAVKNKKAQQQISIVVFSGEAVILCPLTADTARLVKRIKGIEVGKLVNGTAIGSGLMFGVYELSKSESQKKNILIFTDGINNTGDYLPEVASQVASQQNVQAYSFGIGCNGKANAPVARKLDGTYVFGEVGIEIDEERLKSIGNQTGGNYMRITCNAELNEISPLAFLLNKATIQPNKKEMNKEVSSVVIDSIWKGIHIKNKTALDKYNGTLIIKGRKKEEFYNYLKIHDKVEFAEKCLSVWKEKETFDLFLDTLKNELAIRSTGFTLDEIAGYIHTMKEKKDTETPNKIFIIEGNGKKIEKKTKHLRNAFLSLIQNQETKDSIANILPLGRDFVKSIKGTQWGVYKFNKKSMGTVYPILNKLENDAKASDYIIINYLIKR